MEDINKVLEDAEKLIEELEKVQPPTIIVDELYDQYSDLFKGKLGKDFNAIIAKNTIHQVNKPSAGFVNTIKYLLGYKLNISKFKNQLGKIPQPVQFELDEYYTIRFIGATITDQSEELNAVLKIVEELTFLSNNNYLKGNLAKLIKVPLVNNKWAIVSYPLINNAGNEYLKNKENPIYLTEGECPRELGDL